MVTGTLDSWKQRVGRLETETYSLYLAYKDPRVPWYAKVLIACIVGFVFSPFDLIPDFIPVVGYIDDLIFLSIAIPLAIKMIPADVWSECRQKAHLIIDQKHPRNWVTAFIIIFIWLLFLSFTIFLAGRFLKDWFAMMKWWLSRVTGIS